MQIYDIVMAKLLRQEQPVSSQVAKFVMQNQTEYVVRKVDGIWFILGRRGEIPGSGEQVACSARLEQYSRRYMVPLLSQISPMACAIAHKFHNRNHAALVQYTT